MPAPEHYLVSRTACPRRKIAELEGEFTARVTSGLRREREGWPVGANALPDNRQVSALSTLANV